MKANISFEKVKGNKEFLITYSEGGGLVVAGWFHSDIRADRACLDDLIEKFIRTSQGNSREGLIWQGNVTNVSVSRKAVYIWDQYFEERCVCIDINELLGLCKAIRDRVYSSSMPLGVPISFEFEYLADGPEADLVYKSLGGVF